MSILTTTLVQSYDLTAFDGFDAATAFRDAQGASIFRRRDAKALAWAAFAAYEEQRGKIEPVLARWGFPAFAFIDTPISTNLRVSNTHGIMATSDRARATVIAFAGTDPLSLINWLTDFNIGRGDLGSSQGLATAAAAVMPQILAFLRQRPTAHPIVVSGHSLGGALAVVTAHALKRLNDPAVAVEAVLTIGAQRPGSPQFAQDYNARLGRRTFRLVYAEDFVPSVPPGLGPPPSLVPTQHVGLFLHCVQRGGTFDREVALDDLGTDEPEFVDGIATNLKEALSQPLATSRSILARLGATVGLVAALVGIGDRSRAGAIGVETLPQRLRDHFGYLDALKD
jgi:triacylglycerol lipase